MIDNTTTGTVSLNLEENYNRSSHHSGKSARQFFLVRTEDADASAIIDRIIDEVANVPPCSKIFKAVVKAPDFESFQTARKRWLDTFKRVLETKLSSEGLTGVTVDHDDNLTE